GQAVLARGERLGGRPDGTARPVRRAAVGARARAADRLPLARGALRAARPGRLAARHRRLRGDPLDRRLGLQRAPRGVRGAGARMVGGGFGGSVLALLAPGVAAPAGALAVAPGPPAHLL